MQIQAEIGPEQVVSARLLPTVEGNGVPEAAEEPEAEPVESK
jgi:hypothetical protein